MKKQDKIHFMLIIGTLLAFSLAIKSPDCYFPEEKLETTQPTQASIRQINEMVSSNPVVMPTTGLSMYPTIKPKSLCLCRKETDYVYGDIVSYHTVYDNKLYFVMHRIADIIPNEGFITKGDNNNQVDPWIVPEEHIFCKVRETSLLEKIISNI